MEALREQLTEARSRGEDFAECWPGAVKTVLSTMRPPLRREWRRCLERTRETWQRCYERSPATPTEEALEQAHVLIERKPLADRSCVQCDGPLPAGAKQRAEFCLKKCRGEAEVRDRHLGPAGPRQVPALPALAGEDWSEQRELAA